MIHLGIVPPGTTLRIPFDSFAAATGAPAAMSNNAVGDILIYKDSNTTARASTTGYSINATFSSVTGINELIIDLSSDATADFYKSGSFYYVVVSPVTIDGQTMAFVAATFAIGYPAAILNTSIATLASQTSFTLTAGPAEDDALNGMWCLIHDKASAVQKTWCIVEDYTGSTKTVTLSAAPAATYTIDDIDNISFFGPAPGQHTVPGTKLDVTATGAAGVDWGNVENKTTTNALTNTSIITTQQVDVNTIKTNAVVNAGTVTFPTNSTLASTTNITAGTLTTVTTATNVTTVNGLAANVITATSINADAITAAKIADGAIDAATFAAGAITAAVIADGAIDAATFAAGAINAAAIADGAIDQATFASDVPALSIRTNTATAGGASTITLDASADDDDEFYRYDLIKIDSGAGAGQARFITGYVGSTKVATVNRAWTDAVDNTSVFSILPFDSVPGASAPTAAEVATAVWQDATAGDFTTASSIGKALYVANIVPGAAGGHFIAGTNAATTITTALTTTFTGNLTGSVASVTGAVGSVTGAVGSVTGAVGSVTGNVGGNVNGSVASVAGSVGSVSGSVLGTVNGVSGSVSGDVFGSVGSVAGNISGNLEGTLSATERNAIADALLVRDLAAESYAADGAVPTMSQMLYALLSVTSEFSISGQTITCKKLDGSTTAMTFTLDSGTTPTSRTRAT